MRKSIKAPLFSALVFPGSGHYLLRQPVRGTLLVVVSIVCLYALISTAVEVARVITDQLLSGAISPDADSITAAIEEHSLQGDTRLTSMASWGLLGCWLIGIVDSFRGGWLQDRADAARGENRQAG